MKETPTISIITVCYNAASLIEKTLQSVQAQSYPNLEHWVIDGASTDETLEIVKKYPVKWISEPDKGIYDAMNKGANLAQGTYLNFMNAGDTFLENTTVEKVFEQTPPSAEVIYGDYQARFQTYARLIKARPLHLPWTHISVCHQSVFYRKTTWEKYPYSGDFITSDFEQFAKLYYGKHHFYYAALPIANYSDDGVSAKAKIRIAQELLRYIPRYDKSLKTKHLLRLRLGRVYAVETLRKWLPISFFELLEKTIKRS